MGMIKQLRFLGIVLMITLLCQGCGIINPIEFVGIKNVTINQGKDLSIHADVILENPNNLKFKVVDYDLEIFVEGKSFGMLVFDTVPEIARKEQFVAPVSFSISYAELLSTGLNLLPKLARGEFNVQVKGKVDAKVFIFRRTMNFDFTEKVKI